MRHASHLSIGEIHLTFSDCNSADLPANFASFAVEPAPALTTLCAVATARSEKPRAPALAENEVWQLCDLGDRLCFTGGVPDLPYPLMRADIAPDWSHADIRVDAEAPRLTRLAPVTSHFGELMVLAQLTQIGGLYVHAATVAWDGEAHVLLGASGAGKSTLSRLAEHEGATVLSDDRTVLREDNGVLYAHGTPFHGTAARWAAKKLPVRSLTFLSHALDMRFAPHAPLLSAAKLLSLCFTPFWSKDSVERAAASVARLTALVPSRAFGFVPTAAAAKALREAA